MRRIKLGSRDIMVYFSDKKVDDYMKDGGGKGGYVRGFCDKGVDIIVIRKNLPLPLLRICLWHELSHMVYDFMGDLSDESMVEINARYVDEILDRNRWVRELYKKEKNDNSVG